ncbi:MAG: twin transmembrane helix small protein [Alphaproteobacteria bacterium]|nr:twin transmembrane helix small protein [Alphaproteobacteria bacterium]
MGATFFILMTIAMLAVLGALVIGLFGMAKGGAFNKKYGNYLMRARVVLQALALGLFVLAVIAAKK